MTYTTFRRYRTDHAVCGHQLNLPYGTQVHTPDGTTSDMLLTERGQAICLARSHDGVRHFARDDDGHGLERGKLTYAIAHAPRGDGPFRFTNDEREMLSRDYAHWLKPLDVILFNDDFYRADIDDLRELARRLNIEVTE